MTEAVYLVWVSGEDEPAMVSHVRPDYPLAFDAAQDEFRRVSEGKVPLSAKDLTGTAYAGVGDHTKHVPYNQVLVDDLTTPTVAVWVEEWPVQ